MVAQKRPPPSSSSRPTKKPKTDETPASSSNAATTKPSNAPRPVFSSALVADETEFPRGGGTTLTPLEHKEVREEGRREAEKDVEAEKRRRKQQNDRRKKGKGSGDAASKEPRKDKDAIRVEHLNYKRLQPGQKLLARVHSVLGLHLILSLPNQLLAHVPITEVSDTLTNLLTKNEKDSDVSMDGEDDEDSDEESEAPELSSLFHPGQYLTTIISQTFPSESSNKDFLSLYPPSEATRLASRVECSLKPGRVNDGVAKIELGKGYRITGEVRGEEDHGWVVDLGMGKVGVEGFIRKEDAKDRQLVVGQLVDSVVEEMQSNGRIARLNIDTLAVTRAAQSEVTTLSSLLPGHLVFGLITAITPAGLNLKLLGFYNATVDHTHLGMTNEDEIEKTYKIGKKVKGRVIFDYEANAATGDESGGLNVGKMFGMSLLPHVVELGSPKVTSSAGEEAKGKGKGKKNVEAAKEASRTVEEVMKIGTILEGVTVEKVEKEWGLICVTTEGYRAYVHISHIADTRPASLAASGGHYSVGTKHKARVIGHSPFDGIILLSFEQKVLDQRFMLVSEVKVGEVMKGTIHKLTDKAMFVNISGSIDGAVWPLHYADIQLKHPEKRFKAGASVKCRVFAIEPEKGRVKLTLKKSLVESKAAIPTSFDEIVADMVTPAVVLQIFDKGCLVELFSGSVAYVPIAEASDTFVTDLKTVLFAGKPVNVKVTSVDRDTQKIFASIRQALPSQVAATAIEVEDVVSGEVTELHQDQVVLKLVPSNRKALLSLGNLAYHRNVKLASLRTSIKVGEKLDDLVVVVKNEENGLIIVANKAKTATQPEQNGTSISKGLDMSSLKAGQIVPARVSSVSSQGYFLKVAKNVRGRLHITDVADDLEHIPEYQIGEVIKCCVVKVEASNRLLDLSTRPSRVNAASTSKQSEIIDGEIEEVSSLKVGQPVRGLVKNIAGSGLYVSLGRSVTARVMIKELSDDFISDWQSAFSEGQLVKGKILSVDAKKGQVEMSMKSKPGKSNGKKASSTGLADFAVDQKVDTIVKKVETYGIFLRIDGTNVSGLCHRSEIADDSNADVASALKGFREGDKLKAKITSIDSEANKISFGIKPSYFDATDFGLPEDSPAGQQAEAAGADADVDMEDLENASDIHDEIPSDAELDGSEADEDDEEEEEEEAEAGGFLDLEAEEEEGSEADLDGDDEEGESADSDDEVILLPGTAGAKKAQKVPSANGSKGSVGAGAGVPALKAGFDWNAGEAEEDDESDETSESSGDEDEMPAPSKSPKGKKSQGGHQLVEDKTGDVRTKQPESTTEFERALLSSPNSSYLWIQFMSFQLALSEIDKARKIGRRALDTIAFREEEEKLNVWIALINLENAHGTPESFDKVFKEAAQYNDAKTVYLRAASILAQTGKLEQAAEIYQRACKKFGRYPDVWVASAEFEMTVKEDAEAGRALLPRSLKSLASSDHVAVIEKFAILEFRHGEQERGKTIFEGLVDRHPKRLDVWNAYIDQIAKLGDIQLVRNIIDRALDHKLTAKRAKFLFKKLLWAEENLGDEAGRSRAKQLARRWVELNTRPERDE